MKRECLLTLCADAIWNVCAYGITCAGSGVVADGAGLPKVLDWTERLLSIA